MRFCSQQLWSLSGTDSKPAITCPEASALKFFEDFLWPTSFWGLLYMYLLRMPICTSNTQPSQLLCESTFMYVNPNLHVAVLSLRDWLIKACQFFLNMSLAHRQCYVIVTLHTKMSLLSLIAFVLVLVSSYNDSPDMGPGGGFQSLPSGGSHRSPPHQGYGGMPPQHGRHGKFTLSIYDKLTPIEILETWKI